jgi:glycosyltransferase involved in cell wall biosynthesis
MMPILSKSKKPIVVTLHGSGWDAARSEEVFLKYSEPTYIFASDYALKKYSQPAKFEVIHHGIDVDSFTYSAKKDDYLFWMSRINSNKGVTDAIAIANKLKKNLIIAGPIADQAFFDNVVKQSLSDSIRFVGPLDFEKKNQYYSKASAFLFPVNQAEPFGLVCLEALACGTPVVASRLGALPEIIEDGVNGYLVDSGNIEKFCEKINEIEKIDKSTCRESVQEEFSLNKMMNRYFSLYKKIFGNNT